MPARKPKKAGHVVVRKEQDHWVWYFRDRWGGKRAECAVGFPRLDQAIRDARKRKGKAIEIRRMDEVV